MKYKGKVNKDFVSRRESKVKEDDREENIARRQWDFEFVEHHQASIPSTGHVIYEGYEYDTIHPFFGNCDFKHVNRFDEFHISPYILKQLKSAEIDHIVLWRFVKHPREWKESLQLNDEVHYEILDYVSGYEVLKAIEEDTDVKGFTVKTEFKRG